MSTAGQCMRRTAVDLVESIAPTAGLPGVISIVGTGCVRYDDGGVGSIPYTSSHARRGLESLTASGEGGGALQRPH